MLKEINKWRLNRFTIIVIRIVFTLSGDPAGRSSGLQFARNIPVNAKAVARETLSIVRAVLAVSHQCYV